MRSAGGQCESKARSKSERVFCSERASEETDKQTHGRQKHTEKLGEKFVVLQEPRLLEVYGPKWSGSESRPGNVAQQIPGVHGCAGGAPIRRAPAPGLFVCGPTRLRPCQ